MTSYLPEMILGGGSLRRVSEGIALYLEFAGADLYGASEPILNFVQIAWKFKERGLRLLLDWGHHFQPAAIRWWR
jgi:hypothetical protein